MTKSVIGLDPIQKANLDADHILIGINGAISVKMWGCSSTLLPIDPPAQHGLWKAWQHAVDTFHSLLRPRYLCPSPWIKWTRPPLPGDMHVHKQAAAGPHEFSWKKVSWGRSARSNRREVCPIWRAVEIAGSLFTLPFLKRQRTDAFICLLYRLHGITVNRCGWFVMLRILV